MKSLIELITKTYHNIKPIYDIKYESFEPSTELLIDTSLIPDLYIKGTYVNNAYQLLNRVANITITNLGYPIVIKFYYQQKYMISDTSTLVSSTFDEDRKINKDKSWLSLANDYLESIQHKQNPALITSQETLDAILYKIITRVFIMCYLFRNLKKTNPIFINILYFNLPRFIPFTYDKTSDEINTIVNKNGYFNCINGWYTQDYIPIFDDYDYSVSDIIFVSRSNDYLGLLIHELIHLCRLDTYAYDDDTRDLLWKDAYYNKYKFRGKSGIIIEGITNALASIINSIILSIEKDKPFEEIYKAEFKYDYNLCKKILIYFRSNNLNELIKNNNYTQTSQMFEYIFLRYIFLKNFNILSFFKKDLPLELCQGCGLKLIKSFDIILHYMQFIKCLDETPIELTPVDIEFVANNYKSKEVTILNMNYYENDLF